MGAAIQNDAQPLYVVDPAFFRVTKSAQVSEVDGQAEGTAFAGLAEQEEQGVKE